MGEGLMTSLDGMLLSLCGLFMLLNLVQLSVLLGERRRYRAKRGRPITWAELPADVVYQFLGVVDGRCFVRAVEAPHSVLAVTDWQGDYPEVGGRFQKELVHKYQNVDVSGLAPRDHILGRVG